MDMDALAFSSDDLVHLTLEMFLEQDFPAKVGVSVEKLQKFIMCVRYVIFLCLPPHLPLVFVAGLFVPAHCSCRAYTIAPPRTLVFVFVFVFVLCVCVCVCESVSTRDAHIACKPREWVSGHAHTLCMYYVCMYIYIMHMYVYEYVYILYIICRCVFVCVCVLCM